MGSRTKASAAARDPEEPTEAHKASAGTRRWGLAETPAPIFACALHSAAVLLGRAMGHNQGQPVPLVEPLAPGTSPRVDELAVFFNRPWVYARTAC
jgi:hypothetical protein